MLAANISQGRWSSAAKVWITKWMSDPFLFLYWVTNLHSPIFAIMPLQGAGGGEPSNPCYVYFGGNQFIPLSQEL